VLAVTDVAPLTPAVVLEPISSRSIVVPLIVRLDSGVVRPTSPAIETVPPAVIVKCLAPSTVLVRLTFPAALPDVLIETSLASDTGPL
jgi:hypothetical protein